MNERKDDDKNNRHRLFIGSLGPSQRASRASLARRANANNPTHHRAETTLEELSIWSSFHASSPASAMQVGNQSRIMRRQGGNQRDSQVLSAGFAVQQQEAYGVNCFVRWQSAVDVFVFTMHPTAARCSSTFTSCIHKGGDWRCPSSQGANHNDRNRDSSHSHFHNWRHSHKTDRRNTRFDRS